MNDKQRVSGGVVGSFGKSAFKNKQNAPFYAC